MNITLVFKKAKTLAFAAVCFVVPFLMRKLFLFLAELFTIATVGTGSFFFFLIAYTFMFTYFITFVIGGCNKINEISRFIRDKEYREERLKDMPEFIKKVVLKCKYFK